MLNQPSHTTARFKRASVAFEPSEWSDAFYGPYRYPFFYRFLQKLASIFQR